MSAGYSGTPLVKKLGIKPGFALCFLDPPEGYSEALGELPPDIRHVDPEEGDLDFVQLFASCRADAKRHLATARDRIGRNGMIWVSWPKRSSGVDTDLDGNVVRGLGLAAGLVDVKVCAVDDVWSGLKFVIRLTDR